MRSLAVFTLATILGGAWTGVPSRAGEPASWPRDWPVYRHVVIVVEENKDYDQIIDNPAAPYINQVLRAEGANFTRMYGEEHFSEGNYFWLLSGSNQDVGYFDEIPPGSIDRPSLGGQLFGLHPKEDRSFRGYAEDLPGAGSLVERDGHYARKHVPYVSFLDLQRDGRDRLVNLPFTAFPTRPEQFDELPTVAMVIPNLMNDMHGDKDKDIVIPDDNGWIHRGDTWLREHLDPYYQWAKQHNSLLIVTFDENTDSTGYVGPTNPALGPNSLGPNPSYETTRALRVAENRIPTLFAGAHVNPGDYTEGKGITHVNLLRTLEAMYGLPRLGAQQVNAAHFGIGDHFIWDVFSKAK